MDKQQKTKLEQDDYLWDGTGLVDPEVQRLERVLGKFRPSRLAAPVFPLIDSEPIRSSWQNAISGLAWMPRFVAASVLVIAIACAILLSRFTPSSQEPKSGWAVELSAAQSSAAPNNGSFVRKSRLQVGETLETDSNSTASVSVSDVGELDLEPSTRLRLVQSAKGRKRVALERGTIHAAIWAPPGEFVVDTPSAVAVDLGCAYTLHVAPDGSGLLKTTLGWVGFHSNGRDSFIPAGAVCPTHRDVGPGTPYLEDASEPFRNALEQLDFEMLIPESREVALQTVLANARKDDALTLWHLFSRTQGVEREKVYARFASLVHPPDGVTREGILGLDQKQLDLWWNALGFGDISIWRFWEQSPDHPIPGNSQLVQKKEALLKDVR